MYLNSTKSQLYLQGMRRKVNKKIKSRNVLKTPELKRNHNLIDLGTCNLVLGLGFLLWCSQHSTSINRAMPGLSWLFSLWLSSYLTSYHSQIPISMRHLRDRQEEIIVIPRTLERILLLEWLWWHVLQDLIIWLEKSLEDNERILISINNHTIN